MSSAGDIIDALHHAGATLVIEDGKARVRGSRVPDELLDDLRANKAAVLAEWQRRQEAKQDRYGEVPPADAPMVGRDVPLPTALREAVLNHVWQQPRPVHAWVMHRSTEYHTLGVPMEELDGCACLDVLAWQRNTTVKLAIQWLAGMEESYATRPTPGEKP